MADATDLYNLAAEYLQACSDALAISPGGQIQYKTVYPGQPSFDCRTDSLYVHVGGPAISDTYPLQPPLQPMQRIAYGTVVDQVSLTATVLRCVPVIEQQGQVPQLPLLVKIDEAAQITLGDLWAIWNWLLHKHRDGVLFQTPSRRREFVFDPAVSVRAQGGVAGWQIQIRVQLGGFSPAT
jgi:hypothetical protein